MKDIFTSIRRTPYQSLSAFLVLFFTLFLLISIFFSFSFLYGLISHVETRPQVTAYFQTKTPQGEIFKIRDELVNSNKVLSIKYISKDDAFKIYRDLNKNNPLLLEMVSADILPPSLEVYAKKPAFLPEIADYLKKQMSVEEVNFQKDIVDRLISLTGILKKVALVFAIFLILMAVVVMITTTLFKIALKKDEIELLRLLGASDFYIKKPFIFEGIFFGFISPLTALIIIVSVIFYFQPFINSYLKGLPDLVISYNSLQLTVWPMNGVFIAATFIISSMFGMLIGVIASLLATKKYLK